MGMIARYRSAAIAGVLTMLLALSVTVGLAHGRQSHDIEAASRQTSIVAAALTSTLATGTAIVDAVGGLFDGSEDVTPEEFSAFASRGGDADGSFRAVQYSEVVPDAARADFESELAARGYPWGIRVPTDEGLAPAPVRDRYVAITMQEPAEGNEEVFGLDISWREANAALIDEVTITGHPGVGALARIVQTGQPALHIYAPVFAKGAPRDTPAQRAQALVGIAGTVLQYATALQGLPVDPAVEYVVLDPAPVSAQPAVLYSSTGAPADPAMALAWPAIESIDESGLRLLIAARPAPGGLASSLSPWLAGLLVLVAGMSLAAYLVRTAEQRRLVRVTTELQQANDRLRYLSDHDSLTGLLGRDAAHRILDRWIAPTDPEHRQYVAAMFIDIDRFGLVNSTWGHPVGDGVLRELADRLKPFIDDTTLICRLGGDEFLLLRVAPDIPGLQLPGTARAVQRILAEPVAVGDSRQSFTSSIGVALYPVDALDGHQLVAKADAAVRSAQSVGSGRIVVFNPEVEAVEAERIGIERDVSMALLEPDVPFHMVYQPQVRMSDGRCVGLEALIRWPAHPAGPGVFIPVAERSGLIVPLGRYVARAVVRQVRHWNVAGVQVPLVSFNVSADQFVEDFAERLLRMLDDEGVDPHQLEVEVTEYSAMREAAQAQLERLRRRGLRVAIDDFGTGFSSLGRLATLPVDRLKIDRSFVVGLPDDASSVEVVRTIADLSRSLGFEVVCEGVQTDAQAQMLLGFGLDVAQGFRYSRPMPPHEVPHYLALGSSLLAAE